MNADSHESTDSTPPGTDADAFGPRVTAATARQLQALLTLARLGRDRPVSEVLDAVAQAVSDSLGYRTVVLNVYRPAHDDYEVVLVHGGEAAREALLHTTNDYAAFHQVLMHDRFERVPGAYFLPDESVSYDGFKNYVPSGWTGSGEGHWRAEDALLVALRAVDGRPLGVLSVDEPASGLRPSDSDLRLLVAVAAHAAVALETAQAGEETAQHRQALTALVGLSSRLADSATAQEVAERVCATAVPGLGFAAGAVLLRRGDRLELLAERGVTGSFPARLELEPMLSALSGADSDDPVESGGVLVHRGTLQPAEEDGTTPTGQRVSGAWPDHWFLVPLHQLGGKLIGVMVFADPSDGLRPSASRRQELRLLADQVVPAVSFVENRNRLSHLANHDALTGLRNRRDLEPVIDELARAESGVAVLLCDLDRFKETNDRYGHATGDRVLERFADLLRAHARSTDLAIRFGGEEFCVVLPDTTLRDAGRIAERLRAATADWLAELVPGQTVSIGFATVDAEHRDARALLASADAALYAAKAAGRDRCRPLVD